MATRKLTYNKALHFFKNNLLKQQPTENKNSFADIIQKQVDDIGLNLKINDINWIQQCKSNNGFNYKILCPTLEKYIKENVPYMFVRSGTKSRSIKVFLHR